MNTNFKKLTKLMLPFGLLLVAGVPLAERLTGTALPDGAKGFLIGLGIGLMIVALIMQKFKKSFKFS